MVLKCCVNGCTSNVGDKDADGLNIAFHMFPKDAAVCQKWVEAIIEHGSAPNTSCVCSQHFKKEDYQEFKSSSRRFLRDGVVPSVFPSFLRQEEPPQIEQSEYEESHAFVSSLKQLRLLETQQKQPASEQLHLRQNQFERLQLRQPQLGRPPMKQPQLQQSHFKPFQFRQFQQNPPRLERPQLKPIQMEHSQSKQTIFERPRLNPQLNQLQFRASFEQAQLERNRLGHSQQSKVQFERSQMLSVLEQPRSVPLHLKLPATNSSQLERPNSIAQEEITHQVQPFRLEPSPTKSSQLEHTQMMPELEHQPYEPLQLEPSPAKSSLFEHSMMPELEPIELEPSPIKSSQFVDSKFMPELEQQLLGSPQLKPSPSKCPQLEDAQLIPPLEEPLLEPLQLKSPQSNLPIEQSQLTSTLDQQQAEQTQIEEQPVDHVELNSTHPEPSNLEPLPLTQPQLEQTEVEHPQAEEESPPKQLQSKEKARVRKSPSPTKITSQPPVLKLPESVSSSNSVSLSNPSTDSSQASTSNEPVITAAMLEVKMRELNQLDDEIKKIQVDFRRLEREKLSKTTRIKGLEQEIHDRKLKLAELETKMKAANLPIGLEMRRFSRLEMNLLSCILQNRTKDTLTSFSPEVMRFAVCLYQISRDAYFYMQSLFPLPSSQRIHTYLSAMQKMGSISENAKTLDIKTHSSDEEDCNWMEPRSWQRIIESSSNQQKDDENPRQIQVSGDTVNEVSNGSQMEVLPESQEISNNQIEKVVNSVSENSNETDLQVCMGNDANDDHVDTNEMPSTECTLAH